MSQSQSELSPAEAVSHWTYSADGRSAERALGNVRLVLRGEKPAKPRPRGEWLPTLQIEMTGERYACSFEVERQIFTLTYRSDEEPLPHAVWRVNYPDILVRVDGADPVPVRELRLEAWLDFDMLFLGALEP